MHRDERVAVVLLDDVEDDAGVGRVVFVAVVAPAAGAQVQFDIAAELGAIDLDDGVAGVGAVAGGGDAGEADAQAAAILDAGGGAQAGEPALGEGGFAAGGGGGLDAGVVGGGVLGKHAPGGSGEGMGRAGGGEHAHGDDSSPGAGASLSAWGCGGGSGGEAS